MWTVVALEFSQLWHRLGGVRGLLMLAALAAMGTLLPMRLGPALLDPVYLLAYSLLAAIFAGTYSIQSWAGADEKAWLESRGDEGPADIDVLQGKTLVASVYGVASWLLILGASLASLASAMRGLLLPPVGVMGCLVVFTVAVSALASTSAAALAVRFETASMARQMFRLGLFFLLLMGVMLSRAFPSMVRPLESADSFVVVSSGATVAMGALAALMGRQVLRCLADRRISLSINP
jgi:hypothetical protein